MPRQHREATSKQRSIDRRFYVAVGSRQRRLFILGASDLRHALSKSLTPMPLAT